jgi:hypothetical protein
MVAYAELNDARIDRLDACAAAWRKLAERFAAMERRLAEELTVPLRASGWAGPAATGACARLDTLARELAALARQSRTLSAIVGYAAAEFRRLRRNLDGIGDAVSALGLRIDALGRVHPGDDGDALDVAAAKTYDDLVAALLERTTRVDADVSAALRDCRPGAVTRPERLPGIDPHAIPSGDPHAAARWWSVLSDDERHLYLSGYPDRIGTLAGLPAVVRDKANRWALQEWLTECHHRERERAQRLLDLLDDADADAADAADATDAGPTTRRAYLLDIDHEGDGRAVVALGDPDTAAHTAVFVPGVGADLDGIRGLLDRAGALRDAADARHGHDGDVAVVAWLGYDPPGADDILAAPLGGRARDGAPALDTFVDGLRAAHQGTPAHVTAIGHSYGTGVIGEAASHGDGLAVDDIIAVGSPGLRVAHASDLNVGADRVWVLAAANDHVANPLAHGGWRLGALSTWAEAAAHGPTPQAPSFGAHRMEAEPNGHSGYWRPGSASLTNQARIVAGDRSEVNP